jgi:penicillin amidase
MKQYRSIFDFIVKAGPPDSNRTIPDLPIKKSVTVKEDSFGIPHIYAENESDLMTAQGFIHARDRLWQMETVRRLVNGTLSEIAGEETFELDCFTRMAGFKTIQERQHSALDASDRELHRAYAEGINAYIEFARPRFPIEFKGAGFEPAPWTFEDTGGSIILNSWFLQTNYLEEVLAVAVRDRVDENQWNELFGVYPGEAHKPENFFKKFAHRNIGRFLPSALAFFSSLGMLSGGSNNWVVADGPAGLPLLANDPHLESTVPQIWHFCHLHCPTVNVCGASLPSTPGVIIGRNDQVAWGLTNVMTDCCDLFIVDIDPENPQRYKLDDTYTDMETETLQIPIKGKESREVTFYRTVHGPVITALDPGVDAGAALTWYGTYRPSAAASGSGRETTLQAIFAMNRARTVDECMAAGKLLQSVGQNIVIADAQGNIGWYACGSIPKRKGYTGRLPADGSSGECCWDGFVDTAENPASVNPEEGRIVTANHKTVEDTYPYTITHSWIPPYRYEQITSLLRESGNHTIESFSRIQNDLYSKRAEKALPIILGFTYYDPGAQEASKLLEKWDCTMSYDTVGGLVFQVFLLQFAEELLSDLLGEYLPPYFMLMIIFYSVLDRFFGGSSYPSTSADIPAGSPPGEASSLLGQRTLREVCEKALTGTIRYIENALGKNRKKWTWGALHRYLYKHVGGTNFVTGWLLNRGPYPAPGSNDTINVANVNLSRTGEALKQFEVTAIPSMRFISSMADIDSSVIMGPMGQSGKPGFTHYADMIGPWMEGRTIPLPLSREGVEAITVTETLLQSKGMGGIDSAEEQTE